MRVLIVVALLVAAGPCPMAPASTASAEPRRQHIVDLWQQTDGLPQNYVYTVLQGRDGYLWVGTRSGLARFDGVRFVAFDDRLPGQLRESEVWALAEDAQGALWIGTYGGGLTRLHGGRFSTFTTKDGLPSNRVRSLATTRDGSLWIGTENGLARLKDGTFSNVGRNGEMPGLTVVALHHDRQGILWIGTEAGLVSYREGAFRNHSAQFPELQGIITAIAADDSGGVWVGIEPGAGQAGGVRRLEGSSVTSYTVREGLTSNQVMSLAVDGETVWVGTRQGLCHWHQGTFRRYRSDIWGFAGLKVLDRVALQGVPSLAIDHEGSLWFGTQLDGLGRLRRSPLMYEGGGAKDEVGIDVRTLLEAPDGSIWMGTSDDLRRLDGNQVQVYETVPPGAPADAITIDGDGTFLVGSTSGLYRLRSGRLEPSPLFAGRQPNVSLLFTDSRGRTWVGTRADGVFRLESGRLTHFTSRSGLLGDQVRGIAEDTQGGIWVGTRGGGVSRLEEDGRFTTFGTDEGLAGEDVQALIVDRANVVWAATRQGLNRIKDGRVVAITADKGLPANYFYQLLEDGPDLWMSHASGIVKVSLEQLNAVADGRIPAATVEAFGAESGLAHTTVTLAHQPTAIRRRRDGTLWFATTRGAAVMDYGQLPRNTTAPQVHVEEVAVNREFLTKIDGITLQPHQREVALYYTALSFVVPRQVRFKHRLEGFDRDWTDAGPRRAAYYTNLPSGRYRFRVIASNNDNVWNETGASFAFEVLPHWYERTWLWPLAGIAIAFAALLVHQRRLAGLQARERELSTRVTERTAELAQLTSELEDRIKERTAELGASNAALVSEKERLAVTLRSIGDGVIATDVDGVVVLMNRVAETLTGWDAAEATGKPLSLVFRTLDRHTRQPLADPTGTVLRTGASVVGDAPCLLLTPDGREILVADSAAPIRDPESRIVGAVFVFRDVTERERLEDQLRNTQKLEALGVLAGGIAHDFNNLLTGVFGFVDLAREHAGDAEQVRSHTGQAMAVFEKARALTGQLLTFSKAGEPVRRLQRLDPLVREAVAFVLSGSNVVADVDIDPDLWPSEVDGPQVAQVVDNLVLNARQAMPAGGVVTVRVTNQSARSDRRAGPWVRLSVEDNGPGIPRELWPRVFDPFFTTKPGGSGLGLAVVHSIVRRHGGYVEVASGRDGRSARIDVLLPAVPGAVVEAPEASPPCPAPVAPVAPARILVMDDEDYVRNVARSALRRLGHVAVLAKDDREAVALLEQALASGESIDAAILDITIPGGLGGVDALARVRAILPTLPAVASSGYSADAVLARPQEHGFNGALPKPFTMANLRNVLAQVLSRRM